jgi:hypothetical protein
VFVVVVGDARLYIINEIQGDLLYLGRSSNALESPILCATAVHFDADGVRQVIDALWTGYSDGI